MTQPKIEGTGHGIPRMLYASDGSNWYAVLVDSDGHVKVDVVTSALPTDAATETTLLLIKSYVDALETLLAGGLPAALDSGALKVKEQSPLTGFATSANQTTMITALQLIDDLRAALGSVNTDDLQVDVKTYPGVNALLNIPFGYNDRYAEEVSNLNAAAGWNDLLGTAVPAGEVWVVTAIAGVNSNRACTIQIGARGGAIDVYAISTTSAGALLWVAAAPQLILKEGDKIVGSFGGCTAGDDIYLRASGYKMKVA